MTRRERIDGLLILLGLDCRVRLSTEQAKLLRDELKASRAVVHVAKTFLVIAFVALYWLAWLVYWLITGNGMSVIA